jgi:riboflavin kinase/FMN adenylyltransferase
MEHDKMLKKVETYGKLTGTAPCMATIGTFDGVHRGHRFMVDQVVRQAHEKGLDALVVTFPNHPLQVLRSSTPLSMLTLAEEKVSLLLEAGVDRVVMLPFTEEVASMTASEFMHVVLKEGLHVQTLLMGYDNRFGHDGMNFGGCQAIGAAMGIEVVKCDELRGEGKISSTMVRNALLVGDVEHAHELLGYNYFLQGEVVQGFQNGRKLGYPTANLQVDVNKLIPENGVYLVNTFISDKTSSIGLSSSLASGFFGMLNVGTRPTLHNGQQRSIEVHVFDYEGNLYGATLKVELLRHLRKEREFDSLEKLRLQLAEDEKACRSLLSNTPSCL